MTIAASLLSTASVASPNSSPASSHASSPATSPVSETPSTPTGATLPPLPHILPALREALSADPFWGPDHWSYLFSRATQLSAGIQALINECVNLESLVSSPPAAASDKRRRRAVVTDRSVTLPGVLYAIAEDVPPEGKGARLRKSKLAKRQLRLKAEEIELMRRCALQCWAKAAVPSKIRGEILGRGDKRVRSLTCP